MVSSVSGRYSALNLVCPRRVRDQVALNCLSINLKKGTYVTSFRKATYSYF